MHPSPSPCPASLSARSARLASSAACWTAAACQQLHSPQPAPHTTHRTRHIRSEGTLFFEVQGTGKAFGKCTPLQSQVRRLKSEAARLIRQPKGKLPIVPRILLLAHGLQTSYRTNCLYTLPRSCCCDRLPTLLARYKHPGATRCGSCALKLLPAYNRLKYTTAVAATLHSTTHMHSAPLSTCWLLVLR